jgi:hypothetical protein
MNRDDIVRMAQESELWLVIDQHCCEYGEGIPTLDRYPELERFAALVAAHEREACARVCETEAASWDPKDFKTLGNWVGAGSCAAAIRARGEKS